MPDTFPFLYINHGPLAPDLVGKCEECFLWFSSPVPAEVRPEIEKGCPSPLAWFTHWDREFCYFGSQGDCFDAFVTQDFSPPEIRELIAKADPTTDFKAWNKAFTAATKRFPEAVRAFQDALEAWILDVHRVAPLSLFYGPNAGDSEGDPWGEWSQARFSERMYERLRDYKPDKGGTEYLGWIKSLCQPLLTAPRRKGRSPDRDDDARAIQVIDEGCRANRARRHTPRLSYEESSILEQGELVAKLIGKGKAQKARLERLAPLSQLMFLAGYDADYRALEKHYPDLPGRVQALIEGLRDDERRSAVPLLVMMAQSVTHDTPAFDRARKERGALAAALLRTGFDQPGCRGPTYARASRYLRWSGKPKEALAMAEEGLARFGDGPTLLRAARKAAAATGDQASARTMQRAWRSSRPHPDHAVGVGPVPAWAHSS